MPREPSRSELVDCTVILFYTTKHIDGSPRAYHVGIDDEDRNMLAKGEPTWLPASQVEVDYGTVRKTSLKGFPVVTVTMPRWLAEDKDLAE